MVRVWWECVFVCEEWGVDDNNIKAYGNQLIRWTPTDESLHHFRLKNQASLCSVKCVGALKHSTGDKVKGQPVEMTEET